MPPRTAADHKIEVRNILVRPNGVPRELRIGLNQR
jgi:hypothetical protein